MYPTSTFRDWHPFRNSRMFAMQAASHLGSVEYCNQWKNEDVNDLNFASTTLQSIERSTRSCFRRHTSAWSHWALSHQENIFKRKWRCLLSKILLGPLTSDRLISTNRFFQTVRFKEPAPNPIPFFALTII